MLVWLGGKDPGENADFDIDWTKRLAGDTILTSVWTIVVTDGILAIQSPNPGTIPAQSSTTTLTKVWLAAGTDGFTYQLQNAVTTAAGEKPLIENVQLTCQVR